MQAQIVLTPNESKKLIAMAILRMPKIQNALKNGILVMHPSSSTLFIYEMLFGKRPEGLWVCGCIARQGLCGTRESEELILEQQSEPVDKRKIFRKSFFVERGILQEEAYLDEILGKMGKGDVYIKGVNAVDVYGNTGVLIGNPDGGGGSIGMVLAAKKAKGFDIILPAGLEKLIPGVIADASKAADRKAGLTMGMPCSLYRMSGEKVDEVDAIRILSGAKATPISAGGLGGAEGSIVLAIDGGDEQVTSAFELAKTVKGAQLPALNI